MNTYFYLFRNNKDFFQLNRVRKTFHKGSNSSNHFHIQQHYDIYKERCEKGEIQMNHWVTPQNIVKAKAAEAAKEDGQEELGFK